MKNKEQEYNDSLKRIVQLIEKAQVKTMMAANSQFLWAYWNIGQEISDRTNQLRWGTKVIDTLSKDIRSKFPWVKGFSPRNLLYMRQFAEAYSPYLIYSLNHFWKLIRSNPQQAVALLGQGFAFVGRQYQIHVGEKYFYIDLLFYHTQLHCYVVVELKARAFEPNDPAQLNFYINIINDQLKTDLDNETIGILLCKGKDEVVAEYALKGYNNPIGVSDYELSKAIPRELKSTLPDIEELERELKEIDKPT